MLRGDVRSRTIIFRASPDEARTVELVAAAEGSSVSAVLRSAVQARAERLIASEDANAAGAGGGGNAREVVANPMDALDVPASTGRRERRAAAAKANRWLREARGA